MERIASGQGLGARSIALETRDSERAHPAKNFQRKNCGQNRVSCSGSRPGMPELAKGQERCLARRIRKLSPSETGAIERMSAGFAEHQLRLA